MTDMALREQLADFLDWKSAHVGLDDAVKGVPPKLRGAVPKGFAHSVWALVEHVRIAQHDILDFCRNPRYEETKKHPRIAARRRSHGLSRRTNRRHQARVGNLEALIPVRI